MQHYPENVLDYAAQGWRTFPVKQGEKTPAVEGWQSYTGPIADSIGVVTGEASGIIVLDVDTRHGGDDSLHELESKFGPLPDTLRSITANGGAHYYFSRQPGVEVRNGQGIYGLPGLDVRGDGGYVVVPPSSLDSERHYRWDSGSPLTLAPLPEWIAKHGEVRKQAPVVAEGTKNPPGTHHDYLLRLAGSMRRYGAPQEVLEEYLLAMNEANNEPPCPREEVLALAKDAAKRYPQSHSYTEQPAPDIMAVKANDFLNLEVKPPQWLVQNVWPEESIGFVIGPPKVFKSFLALELAYSLSTGAKFIETFAVPEPRRVLLIQQESSRGAFQVRLQHAADRLGGTDNLYIISNRGISLEDPEDLEKFINEIKVLKPALVILDPLASFIRGDENSAQAMGEVIRSLRRIRDECKTGVCIVHHSTKQDTKSIRGSQALYGAAEALVYMSRTDDRDALKSRVEIELKEGDSPAPLYVALDKQTTALIPDRYIPPQEPWEQGEWDVDV
jgi:hypothetical protein